MLNDEMNVFAVSALAEVGNIGAGNATTALSQMTNQKVDISVTNAAITDIIQIPELLGGADKIAFILHLQAQGEVTGDVLFITNEDGAYSLAGLMTFQPTFKGPLGMMEESALKELGNIIAGSYLSAISIMTGMTLDLTPPDLVVDMLGAVLDAILGRLGLVADQAVFMRTAIHTDKRDIEGQFMFLLDDEDMKVLLRKLGLPV